MNTAVSTAEVVSPPDDTGGLVLAHNIFDRVSEINYEVFDAKSIGMVLLCGLDALIIGLSSDALIPDELASTATAIENCDLLSEPMRKHLAKNIAAAASGPLPLHRALLIAAACRQQWALGLMLESMTSVGERRLAGLAEAIISLSDAIDDLSIIRH